MLVKICGITRSSDARCVERCGADFLGLVFVTRSKRHVTVSQARQILTGLEGRAQPVGVFQDHDRQEVVDIVRQLDLKFVQLHGREEPSYANWLAEDLRESRFLKAFAYTGPGVMDTMLEWRDKLDDRDRLFAFLLDGPWGGGEGRVFDWRGLAETIQSPQYKTIAEKLILAGGLNSQNVGRAIRMIRPIGVDVSTGVEERAGLKDHDKIRAFIRESRNDDH